LIPLELDFLQKMYKYKENKKYNPNKYFM